MILKVSIFIALLFVASLSGSTQTRTLATVTASNIDDGSRNPVVSGKLCFAPVDNGGNAIAVRTVGHIVSKPVSTSAQNGVASLTIFNTQVSTPANVCLPATLTDNTHAGASLLPKTGYNCVQMNSTWCSASGGTYNCNFDNYVPVNSGAQVAVIAPGITVGTVNTLAPGSSATASITGTTPNFALNLGAPTGMTGDQGAAGIQGPPGTVSGVPTLLDDEQALVHSTAGATAGYPSAASLQPDALQQQAPDFSPAGTISSVSDASTKAALAAHEAEILEIYNVLKQGGLFVANPLSSTIQSCTGCSFVLFNSTGATSAPLSVSNVIANGFSDTFTATPATGQPNFLMGGVGQSQAGYTLQGSVGDGPAVVPSGPALTSATTTLNSGVMAPSTGADRISSNSQVQGGGSLTNSAWAAYKNTSASHWTLYPNGGTVCLWFEPVPLWSSAGAVTVPTIGQVVFNKGQEFQLGIGTAQVYNGSAYQTGTIPETGTGNSPFVVGSYYNTAPSAHYQSCLVYNPSIGPFGTFYTYLNDGGPNFTATTALTAALSATSSSFAQVNPATIDMRLEAGMYLPGIYLTQPQISGMYHGYTSSAASDHYSFASNKGPAFTDAPRVQWHSYAVNSSRVQDCPFVINSVTGTTGFSNGGNSGTGSYIGTMPHCTQVFQTDSPKISISITSGVAPSVYGNDVSVRIDGALATYTTAPTGGNNYHLNVVNTSASPGVQHTYIVDYGAVNGNNASSFTPSGLYSGMSGSFPVSVSVPNPYNITFIGQSGTVAACITDSIVCTGWSQDQDAQSSQATFVPLERYSNAVNSFGAQHLLPQGFGSALMSTDFNPSGATTYTGVPTSVTTYISNYLTPWLNGSNSNLTAIVIARGVNDFVRCTAVFSSTANCTAIFSVAAQNAINGYRAVNASAPVYVFSPLNYTNFAETNTDGDTHNSYTVVHNITVQEYSGGAWGPVSLTAGTVLSGAAGLWTYRAILADVCAGVTGCTYVELGPGAPTLTGGYQMPNLSTSMAQCYSTVASKEYCFGADNLHPLHYASFLFTRYIANQTWATPLTTLKTAQ
jgi:hypothetical protein